MKQEQPRSYESVKVQPCNSHISMKTPGYLFQAVLILTCYSTFPWFLIGWCLLHVLHQIHLETWCTFFKYRFSHGVVFLEKWKVSFNNLSPRLGTFFKICKPQIMHLMLKLSYILPFFSVYYSSWMPRKAIFNLKIQNSPRFTSSKALKHSINTLRTKGRRSGILIHAQGNRCT